jgi:hypothetical protein
MFVAHEKYQSNTLDWQGVIVKGRDLLTKRDMRKFKELCKDGLLGPGDYRIFENWSGIDKLKERFIRNKDGLVSEGEVQEMNDEENFNDKEPYKERVHGFFLACNQVIAFHCWLLFRPADLEHFYEFEVSFFVQAIQPILLRMPYCSNRMKI